jgi:hypothetical protein
MESIYSHRSVYKFQSFNVIILSFVVHYMYQNQEFFNSALTFNHSDRKGKENIINLKFESKVTWMEIQIRRRYVLLSVRNRDALIK